MPSRRPRSAATSAAAARRSIRAAPTIDEVIVGSRADDDPRRAQVGDGVRRPRGTHRGPSHCRPRVRARDGEPQIVEDTARLAGIAAGHIDRLDAKEPGAGDRTEDRDVETHARAAEASRDRGTCRAGRRVGVVPSRAQPRPCSMPPTCSSSFQATSASLFTNARKSQNVMTSVRRSVVAVTVAVRDRSLMSATSPK